VEIESNNLERQRTKNMRDLPEVRATADGIVECEKWRDHVHRISEYIATILWSDYRRGFDW
jgi:hypothetical protein